MVKILVPFLLVRVLRGWLYPGTRRNLVRRRNNVKDICEVAEALGIELISKSGGYWSLCPFHDEKTPSFKLSPEKGVFYCFGCGAKGNAFHLTQKMRSCNFEEASSWLLSLSLLTTNNKTVPMVEQKEINEHELRLVLSALARYYAKSLSESVEAGAARMYLYDRGISPETTIKFGLGYAPSRSIGQISASRYFLQELQQKNVSISIPAIDAVGVKSFPKRDRFAERLVLPIRDPAGQTVGFGSRLLPQPTIYKKNVPKYVNSPVSSVFAKSRLLFGLDQAAPFIRQHDEAIIVEGYFDVLTLHDCGIRNVVAALGVTLTRFQIEHAARYSESRAVILLLDSDSAGNAATDKLCASLLPNLVQDAGLDVSVSHLKPFKDAADFVQSIRKHQDDAGLRSLFAQTILANKIPWEQRRDKVLLGDLFKPGAPNENGDQDVQRQREVDNNSIVVI
uniref:Toprim domain-containing protein n=1 Tax=Aureoumbra lagunensis TaxID=44058 RepID=A0A7S3NM81_9STRA